MAQALVSQRFCVQCGAAMTGEQYTCSQCGAALDARLRQPEQQQDHAEATLRIAARPVPDLRADEQHGSLEDADKTVRAATRWSSRLYEEAARQELLAEETRRGVGLPRPLLKKRAPKKTLTLIGCGVGLFLLLSLLVLGVANYSGTARAAQQIGQNQAALDQLLAQAQAMGVPAALLQPALRQEQQLASSSNIVARLFNNTAYQKSVQGYHALMTRVADIMTEATAQAQGRAQQDVQNFQTALTRATVQGPGNIESFSQQLSQYQSALAAAKTPKDYAVVSQDARAGVLSLGAMELALSQLADFNTTIARLQTAGIDVTALEAAYQTDLQLVNRATRAQDFQNLGTLIDAQYQQVVVSSVRAFPYVSVSRLNELQTQISQLKTYGLDASAYQKRLTADQVALAQTKTVFDDLVFLKQVDADIASMHDELVQGEARYLVKQFDQAVISWAKAHPYYDSYNGHTYALDSGYMQAGIGAGLDSDLAGATTTADYEAMVTEAQNALFNLHMLEADYNDHTPYNQVHQTDLAMLNHYKLQNRTVLLVSLVEQVMRVYQNGTLLRAFYVTTGRSELPSLPGVWGVLERKSPMIFVAADPKGSPYWFPPTPIEHAIMYHYGGYFVHDAWWRASFGPGTQFPHLDAGGNTAYNFDGSHGCINLSESDAAWVYQHTDWNTMIVIY